MAKTRSSDPQSANHLLAILPSAAYRRLLPRLQPVNLQFKQVLMQARKPFEYAYFPTRGLSSALTVMSDGGAIEVGTVGSEGLVGVSAALGVFSSPHQHIVQVAGEALRIKARVLAEACTEDGPLRQVLMCYYSYLISQVSQSVACNGLHSVAQRCCRWVLLTHDGSQSDHLPLTHEFLAMMLGVRRVSITLVLQPLAEQGLIRNGRGKITVLNRRGLEVAACECYQNVRDEYDRLMDEPAGNRTD
jgi:CRP-like cAMP-binding protein